MILNFWLDQVSCHVFERGWGRFGVVIAVGN